MFFYLKKILPFVPPSLSIIAGVLNSKHKHKTYMYILDISVFCSFCSFCCSEERDRKEKKKETEEEETEVSFLPFSLRQ